MSQHRLDSSFLAQFMMLDTQQLSAPPRFCANEAATQAMHPSACPNLNLNLDLVHLSAPFASPGPTHAIAPAPPLSPSPRPTPSAPPRPPAP
eukprot:CAMPEP_0196781748 /NCGR_PEP_ID=MMETSP1104-20130614/10276_1 /TAXON_ID=33652 /ORGANISM="Cafeteria sp., Strain Caron Lab Isolate" /LENGTH=91 /DNA_ID=CAMNT_0042151977 /DNA_START=65 /DNA_END=337 /DNA_ORIENTATION=-